MSSYGGYLFETFLTLILVCGVAFGVLYGARRLGFGRATGPIRLVGQLPLDGRRFIYLVRVGDLVFVVGVGEGGFTKLGEMKSSELPAAGGAETESPAFAKILANAFNKGGAAAKSAEKPLEREPEDRT
jgi:flagellar biogenesis protein FliO